MAGVINKMVVSVLLVLFIKYSMQGEDFNLAVQHSAVDGLLTMGFASISNVFKTSSGNITITMLITQIKELIVGQLQLKMWWIILVVLSQKCMLLQNQNLFLKNRHSVGLVVAQ